MIIKEFGGRLFDLIKKKQIVKFLISKQTKTKKFTRKNRYSLHLCHPKEYYYTI